jgi:hypothetical protein
MMYAMPSGPRRVVYIIIDGMNRDALEQAIHGGRAPALGFIAERARYVRDSVAVFPTITPAATASLVTGATPAQHGIPGMCWYSHESQRFVNYGQSPRAAVIEGVSQVVEDFLVNLNAVHLSRDVQTIHERLDGMGLTTASINYMVFRGPFEHELRTNLLERLLLFKRGHPDVICGPKEHYFADMVVGPAEACTKLLSVRGPQKRLRATDGWAACVTRELLAKERADMILFYLHENDHTSHRSGPAAQVDSLADADGHIAYVLDSFASWEEALDRVGFVVTADHSQSPVSDEKDHIVDFMDVFDDLELVRPDRGREPFRNRDLAVAGNGRVVFFYLQPERRDALHDPVVRRLMELDGVDQVMWRDAEGYVVNSNRGRLRFRADRRAGVRDERGNYWSCDGDLGAVDGIVEADELRTPEYPLALWRIASALDCERIGDIVATMNLTYEATDLAGADHRGGGDHASLHAQDSTVPFLSTLGDPPLHPATTDVVPHIVGHFERQRS